MMAMVIAFTVMSGLYLSALGLGAAANAIFLQNTAPVWVYLLRRALPGGTGGLAGLADCRVGHVGAVVIVAGGLAAQAAAGGRAAGRDTCSFMGLGSGFVYAVVVLFLRVLREQAAAWLVALNLLGTAVTLGLFVAVHDGPSAFASWASQPSARQFALLAVFGALQMALPYWLFTRGLRSVSPQEAAIITLIEPLLNPIWAFLITPEKDTPTVPMLLGGGLILLALVWRYTPILIRRRIDACAEKTGLPDHAE